MLQFIINWKLSMFQFHGLTHTIFSNVYLSIKRPQMLKIIKNFNNTHTIKN